MIQIKDNNPNKKPGVFVCLVVPVCPNVTHLRTSGNSVNFTKSKNFCPPPASLQLSEAAGEAVSDAAAAG